MTSAVPLLALVVTTLKLAKRAARILRSVLTFACLGLLVCLVAAAVR